MGFTPTTSVPLCCDKETNKQPFNPFGYQSGAGHSNGNWTRIFELENPLPNEISDPREVKKLFDKFKFIPFSGYNRATAHKLVNVMQQMKYLSPTKGAVMTSVNEYSFGGKIQLVRTVDPEFELNTDEVILQGTDQTQYYDFLKSINLNGESWMSLTNKLSDSKQTTGNMYLELVFSEIAGERVFTINYLDPAKVCYFYQAPGLPKMLGVSAYWDYEYVKKNPPPLIGLYPNATQVGDTIRTIIHWKDGTFEYYGRPQDFASFNSQYNEYRIREYMTKQIDTGFLGQLLMEFEGSVEGTLTSNADAKKHGFRNALDRLEKNYTNAGRNPTSVIATTRDKGASPVEVHQFKPNTSEKFFREVNAELRSDIVMTNDWSEALLKKDKASGFNSNILQDIFLIENCTKIRAHVGCVSSVINTALREGAEWLENSVAATSSIQYDSPVNKLIEVFDERDQRRNTRTINNQ